MKMTRAHLMRLATGLGVGMLCQCELPDAEYFAQKWEEPRVVFDPPKWQLAQIQPDQPLLDEAEFPPVPYMSPELPLVDGAARLTPPVADSRAASLLPALTDSMAADREFNVVEIPEWKGDQEKPAAPVVDAKEATLNGLTAALPTPPPPTQAESPRPPVLAANTEQKPAASPAVSAEKVNSDLAAKVKEPQMKAATDAVGGALKTEAKGGADDQEKIKVVGAAPGLSLTKPPGTVTLGNELASGLAAKGAAGGQEKGGAASEPMTDAPAPAAEKLPEGLPVEGRPGLVRSPYGQPHQLVDVSDLKPGDLIKCPFSGKAFRIPKLESASAKPLETPPAEAKPDKPE